ncbi:hypothetical protein DFH11DRAFT_1113194 [Phellopilus nigrolimitatus]|nr:hypothetical protein DFH11DRAFT_1113194 [Phellopilus nigrolimitatus]
MYVSRCAPSAPHLVPHLASQRICLTCLVYYLLRRVFIEALFCAICRAVAGYVSLTFHGKDTVFTSSARRVRRPVGITVATRMPLAVGACRQKAEIGNAPAELTRAQRTCKHRLCSAVRAMLLCTLRVLVLRRCTTYLLSFLDRHTLRAYAPSRTCNGANHSAA